ALVQGGSPSFVFERHGRFDSRMGNGEALMIGKLRVGAVACAVFLLGMCAGPAFAQVNTGTVLGTVKDAQGGVIPGATVTLISEARGTRSAPVVTNENGDFVFANVTADTYTVEVTLESFKTSQRAGIAVSPGTRVTVGT